MGIGGDPVSGSSFRDRLGLFEHEEDTDRRGPHDRGLDGPQEAGAAQFVRERMTKPVIRYVAGLSAPAGRTMGPRGGDRVRDRGISTPRAESTLVEAASNLPTARNVAKPPARARRDTLIVEWDGENR